MKKRRQETHKNGECEDDAKKQKTNYRSQEEWLKASTIPLWNVPYDKQVSFYIALHVGCSEEQTFQQEFVNTHKLFSWNCQPNEVKIFF